MTRPRLHRMDRQHGQSMVEFALILTPLMIIFLGILQFGLLFGANLGLINSTREGARYGATLQGTGSAADAAQVYCYTLGMDASGNPCSINTTVQTGTLGRSMPSYAKTNVCRVAGGVCGSEATTVSYCYFTDPNASTSSLRLNVTIVYRHPLFIPLISLIVDQIDGQPDNALRVSTTESFRVEGISSTSPVTDWPGVTACTN
ncbi:MAG: hypothetical protein C0498_08870 [Anaerolinea sp.]|nr:hypothetical protein [Anaerolinea sp.]